MLLAAGLCLDPLEKLTALPRPPSWISGVGTGKEGEGEEGKGEGRKAREGKRERKEEGLDHRQ